MAHVASAQLLASMPHSDAAQKIERAIRVSNATYVGESAVRHFDRVPGDSVGDYLLRRVSEVPAVLLREEGLVPESAG
jgi:hypothetical protein